jgi:hypothetical protein
MSRICASCTHWTFKRQGNAQKAGQCALQDRITLERESCDKHAARKPVKAKRAAGKASG